MEDFNEKFEQFFTTENQLSLYRFSLPLTKAIDFKGHKLTSREGLWLVKRNANAEQLIGEISPLPGFSQETLAQCEQQLLTLLHTQTEIMPENLFPSVNFALFCLDQKIPYEKTQNKTPQLISIPLLQGSPCDILSRYQALNYPNKVKLKVARQPVSKDIQTLQDLIKLNPNVIFRLDANQQWTMQQYNEFLKQINSKHLDYIEEPTASLQDNINISEQFNVAIGLDESLLSEHIIPIHDCIKALIIKPTLIGCPSKIQSLLKHAQKQQLSISVSASFESPLALNQLSNLAQQWQTQYQLEVSLGLDTMHVFQNQYFKTTSPAKNLLSVLLSEATCLWHH